MREEDPHINQLSFMLYTKIDQRVTENDQEEQAKLDCKPDFIT